MARQKKLAVSNREECAEHIRKIGDLQGEVARLAADYDEHIRMLKEEHHAQTVNLNEEIKSLQGEVQAFCEANRAALTQDGKVKTVDFGTGYVKWRAGKPSCVVSNPADVVALLKAKGLYRLISVKEEVDKHAVLKEPAVVADIAGVQVIHGEEKFVIEPVGG